MSYSDEELQIEIDGLTTEIKIAQANIIDFGHRHFNGVREKALVYCLSRAADIAEGCFTLARMKIPYSLGMLDRGLIECLVWTCWVVKSDENAQTYQDLAVNELKRIVRKNLQTGYGKVRDTTTQEDKSQEFLQSPIIKNVPQRLRIEEIAKAAGLGRLYTQIYGPLSLEAHGGDFGISDTTVPDERCFNSLAIANATLECINLVVKNWIVHRKQTEISKIYKILYP